MKIISGNSGDKIEIYNNSIIKSSDKIDRLNKQAQKQKDFYIPYRGINSPKIYSMQTINKKYQINMEYINGKNFIDYLSYASINQIDLIIDKLINIIKYNIECSGGKGDICDLLNKYDDLKNKIKIIDFDKIDCIVNLLPDICNLPIGVCHGDLTLSNIIFKNNEIYLIDFLDVFIESPIQDMVKIRQDTKYRWSCNFYIGNYDKIKIKIILDYIDNKLVKFFKKYEFYKEYYQIFQILNFLRILPYCKHKQIETFIINILNSLI